MLVCGLNPDVPLGRALVIISSTLFVLLTSGPIYGWPSLLLVYKEEGLFKELCFNVSSERGSSLDCTNQDLQLNLIYTLAVIGSCTSSLPIGILLDNCGPRLTTVVGSLLFILSCLLISLSKSAAGYQAGFFFLQFSGSCIFLGLIPIADLFSFKNTMISVYNIAFDASTVVFLVYLQIFNATKWASSQFFLYFTIVPAVCLIFCLFWPQQRNQQQQHQQQEDEQAYLLEKRTNSTTTSNEGKQNSTFISNLKAVGRLLLSKDYLLWAIYMPITLLWSNMYLGTVEERLASFASPEDTVFLVELFAILLPSVIFVSPLIGWVVDKMGYRMAYMVTHFVGCFWSILIAVEWNPYFQITSFVVFTVFRALYFSNGMVYAVHLFGFKYFGQGWGITFLFLGAMNAIPYFLLELVLNTFRGSFVTLNYIQVGSWLLCFFFPLYLCSKWHSDLPL